jgi:hypothetical protein
VAATGLTIKVEGARQFRRSLNQMEKGLGGSEMKAVHLKVAKLVQSKAVPTTPRRSGRLAASVQGKATTRQATIRANRFLYRGIAQAPFEAILAEYSEGVDDIARRAGLV